MISLHDYSAFVEQGKDDELEDALREMLNTTYSKEAASKEAIKAYGQDTMCKNYYKVYEDILR